LEFTSTAFPKVLARRFHGRKVMIPAEAAQRIREAIVVPITAQIKVGIQGSPSK